MSTPQKPLPKVPPFVERKKEPPRRNGMDTRGMLSVVTMLVSLAALTASMLGAGKLVLDIFNDGLTNSMDGIFVKVVVLGLSFLFGWGVGLTSIRGFQNLVYPIIINIYAWAG
jgi:Na+(H+)/acetate symporter ActP